MTTHKSLQKRFRRCHHREHVMGTWTLQHSWCGLERSIWEGDVGTPGGALLTRLAFSLSGTQSHLCFRSGEGDHRLEHCAL